MSAPSTAGTSGAPQPEAPRPQPAAGAAAGARLLAELRAETERADNKAAVLVAALGITAGLLGGLLSGSGWSPGRLPVPVAVAWWTGTASLAVSLLALMLAIMPRYRRSDWRPGLPLTYFQDIRLAADQGCLAEALADTERDPATALVDALTSNSRIVASKHRWIRTGLGCFGLSALLLGIALFTG